MSFSLENLSKAISANLLSKMSTAVIIKLESNRRNYNPRDEQLCLAGLSPGAGRGWGWMGVCRGAQLAAWLIRMDVMRTVQLTCPPFQEHPPGSVDPCRGLKEEICVTGQYKHQLVQHTTGGQYKYSVQFSSEMISNNLGLFAILTWLLLINLLECLKKRNCWLWLLKIHMANFQAEKPDASRGPQALILIAFISTHNSFHGTHRHQMRRQKQRREPSPGAFSFSGYRKGCVERKNELGVWAMY